jgi:hypothetical protein
VPLSKEKDRERKRKLRRNKVSKVMSSADVRAMRRVGIDPEKLGDEGGKISSRVFYSVVRELEAVRAHLSWHHESVKNPDIVTILERMQVEMATQSKLMLEQAQQIRMLQFQVKELTAVVRELRGERVE